MDDCIEIHGLRLVTRLGVPEEERAAPQVVEADILLYPSGGFANIPDEITATVDYSQVADVARQCALAKPRLLLETLANDLAAVALAFGGLERVTVQLRKFILPGTEWVGIGVERLSNPGN